MMNVQAHAKLNIKVRVSERAVFVRMSQYPHKHHLEHLRKGIHAGAPRVVSVDTAVPGWTKTVEHVEATCSGSCTKCVNAWVARSPPREPRAPIAPPSDSA